MSIDIRPHHLHIVQYILQQYVPDARVRVFGSRAKGTARKTSDLDLCIDAGAPLSFTTAGNLSEDFAESDLPYKVDVVDWHACSPDFQELINSSSLALPLAD